MRHGKAEHEGARKTDEIVQRGQAEGVRSRARFPTGFAAPVSAVAPARCPSSAETRAETLLRPVEQRVPAFVLQRTEALRPIGAMAQKVGLRIGGQHLRHFAMLRRHAVDGRIRGSGDRHRQRVDFLGPVPPIRRRSPRPFPRRQVHRRPFAGVRITPPVEQDLPPRRIRTTRVFQNRFAFQPVMRSLDLGRAPRQGGKIVDHDIRTRIAQGR
jgi:hypothetical protein